MFIAASAKPDHIAISERIVFAFSMACAFAYGPWLALGLMAQRQFAYLPPSRRDLWRSQWLIGSVIPVACMLSGKLVALLAATSWSAWGHRIGIGAILLSTAYDFACAGLGMLIVRLAAQSLIGKARASGVIPVGVVILFLTTPALPFLIPVPLIWRDFTEGQWLLLAAAVGVATAGYFYSPKTVIYGRRHAPTGDRGSAIGTMRLSPGLAFARLVWPEIALAIGVAFMVGGLFAAVNAIFRNLGTNHRDTIDANFVYWLLAFSLSAQTQFSSSAALRALRVLPWTTWKLTSVFSAVPLAIWTIIFLTQYLLRIVYPAQVPALSPGLFACFIGVSSLAQGVGMTWRTRIAFFIFVFGAGGIMGIGNLSALLAGHTWLPWTIGAAGTVAGVLLNYRAITHGSTAYKAIAMPLSFGMQMPPTA